LAGRIPSKEPGNGFAGIAVVGEVLLQSREPLSPARISNVRTVQQLPAKLPARLLAFRATSRGHAIERTTPPSTRSAAPVVADACGEQT